MVVLSVSDSRSNIVEVEVDVREDMGSVRNSVNKVLKCGFCVEEFDLVPWPFCHYVQDDPELFGKGPSDQWRVADVFYEALTTSDVIGAMSVVPLGPVRRVGLVFPDFVRRSNGGRGRSPLFRAAQKILSPREPSERSLCLIDTLESVERDLSTRRLERDVVVGVAGFGFDGQVAALVYAGSLTFEDAIRAIEDTERPSTRWTAWSIVGEQQKTTENSEDLAVFSHFVFEAARVCVTSCDDDGPRGAKRLEHRLIEKTGAHTPFCILDDFDDGDYDISTPTTPFYSSCLQRHQKQKQEEVPSLRDCLFSPIFFADAIRALVDDQAPTELLVASSSSSSSNLKTILGYIAPSLTIL